ncbi:MAG: hypothetical protein PWP03_128 [Candidatus Woesearchaeota archaeon]|nr:hypothetical protein [Candidatus Woesearchaeota archaeon]MDN5327490.1 hypothetical protein [Candidatus Woesearchaeota archaeon]
MAIVKIVGTSHISEESKTILNQAFLDFNPDIIALELDFSRLQSLLSKPAKPPNAFELIRSIGIKSYLFYIIAKSLQKTLSKIVKTEPGIEMLEAVSLAHQYQKPILLIDQNITITMRKLSKCLGLGFIWLVIKDFFTGIFKRRKVRFDIRKVPKDEVVVYLIKELKKSYPCLYKVLVEDRNKFMANKISSFVEKNPDKKILVVVGAGHKDGLIKLLKRKNIECV